MPHNWGGGNGAEANLMEEGGIGNRRIGYILRVKLLKRVLKVE